MAKQQPRSGPGVPDHQNHDGGIGSLQSGLNCNIITAGAGFAKKSDTGTRCSGTHHDGKITTLKDIAIDHVLLPA
jgi:hypothetical protein